MMKDITGKLEVYLGKAIKALFTQIPPQDIPQIYLESPKNKTFADLSSNIALRLSGACKQPAQKIAQDITRYLTDNQDKEFKDFIKQVEAKSGFINFFFHENYLYETLRGILKARDNFGRADISGKKKVQIEFVSANPTGPLSVAHARQAAVGDALANILSFLGFNVTREYYVNDEGLQIELLGKSIKARYDELCGRPGLVPEGGYQGDYIYDIANQVLQEKKKDVDFAKYGVDYLLKVIRDELKLFNVRMDNWSYQSALTKRGEAQKIVEYLKKKKLAYEKDGAVWFSSSKLGDDKDRVLVKSDGSFTYLTPDIAYHRDKYRRGFESIINIWGPDHHGYIPRLKAAVKALDESEDSLSIIIVQLATLYRNGQPIPMSTRAGQYITLRAVVEEVGVDAARFFFLMRRTNSHLVFDLDLAKRQSPENPVYYIQYAHARIAGILSKLDKSLNLGKIDFSLLKQPEELEIIKTLVRFPLILEVCQRQLDSYSLVEYLQQLANNLHKFYDRHRVIGEDKEIEQARLGLIRATKIVLANGLKLLGVSVPDKM
jgi:arginyl-tRNA synthetase